MCEETLNLYLERTKMKEAKIEHSLHSLTAAMYV